MERIICLSLCVLTILLLKIILKINFKKAKELDNNKELQNITNRFPDNLQITKEMLEIIKNNTVKVEQNKNTKTNFYIRMTNKIIISDLKDNYGRIGTIAHECLHSIQDKGLLMFNFFFSNCVLLYWICLIVLVAFNILNNVLLQLFILMLLLFIQTSIRLYLETDAMLKSIGLSNEYIKNKKICSENERNLLINQYKIINDTGIRFYIFTLISNSLLKIISIVLVSYIVV